jgi:hypothetical protein
METVVRQVGASPAGPSITPPSDRHGAARRPGVREMLVRSACYKQIDRNCHRNQSFLSARGARALTFLCSRVGDFAALRLTGVAIEDGTYGSRQAVGSVLSMGVRRTSCSWSWLSRRRRPFVQFWRVWRDHWFSAVAAEGSFRKPAYAGSRWHRSVRWRDSGVPHRRFFANAPR